LISPPSIATYEETDACCASSLCRIIFLRRSIADYASGAGNMIDGVPAPPYVPPERARFRECLVTGTSRHLESASDAADLIPTPPKRMALAVRK
jgi:hypothetical protein